MNCIVSLKRVAETTETERGAERALLQSVYPPEETTEWPGRHLEWAPSDWCVHVCDEQGRLLSYTGIVLRRAAYEGRPVRIGGIGGVKTHPAARRRGYARMGLERAIRFFREQQDVAFALLVCRPQLIGTYASMGWQEYDGRLLVRQFGKVTEFTFNRVMIHDVSSAAPRTGTIDLCGPPW